VPEGTAADGFGIRRERRLRIDEGVAGQPNVADLYRCRWQIEVFFKQIKQTLQLADFLGHNANAVRWQVWMALLVYVLLRYLSYLSRWAHSFMRLFTILRAVWGISSTCSSYSVAIGQQPAVSATWRGQNKSISQGSYETMGQQIGHTSPCNPPPERGPVEIFKSRSETDGKIPSETRRKSSNFTPLWDGSEFYHRGTAESIWTTQYSPGTSLVETVT
jgi:hypothetical protein